MPDTPPLPHREADLIRMRRLELGWTQHRLAHESGISVATVRKLEGNKQPYYRALTVVPLCLALGWRPDSLDTLLAPGTGSSTGTESGTQAHQSADSVVDDADNHGAGTQQDLLAAFDGGLKGLDQDQLDELAEFLRQLRRRRP